MRIGLQISTDIARLYWAKQNGFADRHHAHAECAAGGTKLEREGLLLAKREGNTQDEIRQTLGPPLAVYEHKATKVLWYSQSPSSSNYHLRNVGVDKDGKVVHIWKEIYWD